MHPSIVRIKNSVKNSKEFPFEIIDKKFIEKVKKRPRSKDICATK